MKDRIWITTGFLVAIALWTVLILSTREYAMWKSTLRDYFYLQNAATDRDIATLKDLRLHNLFGLYSVFLIGVTPIALQKLFRRLDVGIAVIVLLFLPCIWYGLRIMHVSGKMVDWVAAFGNTPP